MKGKSLGCGIFQSVCLMLFVSLGMLPFMPLLYAFPPGFLGVSCQCAQSEDRSQLIVVGPKIIPHLGSAIFTSLNHLVYRSESGEGKA